MLKKYLIALSIFTTPHLFAEEFNQFCVTSLSDGVFNQTDCSVSHEYQNKKYCFGNKVSKEIFLDCDKF